ncbi:MAG: ubiquinone/menaquinone biosynthesis methyltransferase [Candidatus Latescibacteria bacterium]|nr:ubiquinone/menaquinone biosynthesis methyltransferase [Candidatus Latescibacterota bacterium]
MSAHLREWPLDREGRARYADSIFAAIAARYDLLTTLLSFGQDRRWKASVVAWLPNDTPRGHVLDLATGTAAIPLLLRRALPSARIVGLDRSRAMIEEARRKCAGDPGIEIVHGDLNAVPFAARRFDAVTMAYGLRYLTDIRRSIAEIFRLLRPGGVIVCLDFGLPKRRWYRRLALGYLLAMGTVWGLLLHRRADTYWHIVESLRAYPGQDAVAAAMREVGFTDVSLEERLGGISVTAYGRKPA